MPFSNCSYQQLVSGEKQLDYAIIGVPQTLLQLESSWYTHSSIALTRQWSMFLCIVRTCVDCLTLCVLAITLLAPLFHYYHQLRTSPQKNYVRLFSVSYSHDFWDGKIGTWWFLGWESNRQKSAKLEGGNLSLGVGNPSFPTLCMKHCCFFYSVCASKGLAYGCKCDLPTRFWPIRFVLDVLFMVSSEISQINVKAFTDRKPHHCLVLG